MKQITPGIYKHYKGNLYQVIDVALHTETEEKLVVYRALYGTQQLFVRPLDMFLEKVRVKNQDKSRFERYEASL